MTHLLREVGRGEVVEEEVDLVLHLLRRLRLLQLPLVGCHQQGIDVCSIDGGGLRGRGEGGRRVHTTVILAKCYDTMHSRVLFVLIYSPFYTGIKMSFSIVGYL